MKSDKKLLLITFLCLGMVMLQSFVPKHDDDDEKPKNLKVLPKNISGKELHKIMKAYSMSLGVRCNFCHVSEQIEGREKPKFDFASDAKPEKITARNMMHMEQAVNEKYISQMTGGDHTLEQITCVTCHMGRKTPIITIDSLPKRQ
jgi:Photosynthetic reaction centre cytochrome C subunit